MGSEIITDILPAVATTTPLVGISHHAVGHIKRLDHLLLAYAEMAAMVV